MCILFKFKPFQVIYGENGTEQGIKFSLVMKHADAHTELLTLSDFQPPCKRSENLKLEKMQYSCVTCSAASPEVGLN